MDQMYHDQESLVHLTQVLVNEKRQIRSVEGSKSQIIRTRVDVKGKANKR